MSKGKVLVIDDDPGIVETIEAILEDAGYDVLSSVNGAALQIAHDVQPDLILLDIMMPVMDGVEVSKRLRADPVTQHIPIVVMSAQHKLHATAALMPIDDQLSKPFDLGALYATVDRWVTTT